MSVSARAGGGSRRGTVLLCVGLLGCGGTAIRPGVTDGSETSDGPAPDMPPPMETPCGDFLPNCNADSFGPPAHPFPFSSDPDPRAGNNGVERDPDGYLGLGKGGQGFHYLWIANTDEWGRGSISKIDSRAVKEVARYFSVTCYSNPGGSRQNCDGVNGCCSVDDHNRFVNRMNGQPNGGGAHQAVQLMTNYPSRTAVDWNGDVWVANRAFGGQSSVTKIANDLGACSDRNGTPGVQTSSDVDGNGVIDTDCNDNGIPDDVADVVAKACTNGKPQEFYGFDDDCVLFTTNTNLRDKYGRPLALGKGAFDFSPSDAWPGTYQDGKFFRVDGTTGQIKTQAQGPLNAYGGVVDKDGILWVAVLADGHFTYIDTANPTQTGITRTPTGFALNGYGIALDRDQNVWEGGWTSGSVYRYTPDRSMGFARLGMGSWTVVTNPGSASGASGSARGIAADTRTPQDYFVWVARDGGWIVRIDASKIPLPMGMDLSLNGQAMQAVRVAGTSTIGAGVDVDQNVWGVSYDGSVATRIKVDAQGGMVLPDVLGGNNNAGCPVGNGDRCTLGFKADLNLHPYTYSDFTGFGLRNFTNPKGSYSYVHAGCTQGDTRWTRVVWDGDVPPNTSLTVRVRTGMTATPDNTWGAFTAPAAVSPADITMVVPNNPAAYLQVEFDLATTDRAATPKLKSYSVYYECLNVPG